MPNAHNGHNGTLVRIQLFRGGQLAEGKGLGDIVIRASIRGIDFVIPLSRTVNIQDGEALGQLAQGAAGCDASHARHVDVEQHCIVAFGANKRYRLFSGGRFLDLKPRALRVVWRARRIEASSSTIRTLPCNGCMVLPDQGKRQKECRPRHLIAVHPETPVVRFRSSPCNRETNSAS